MPRRFIAILCIVFPLVILAQSEKVNVFLGSSGDHGQMSPGASYPFSMMDICPQTYPNGHTGYEYKAKRVLGFTHNRFEGVGCQGSGGNILIEPFDQNHTELTKQNEKASPGFYSIGFTNGITAKFTVFQKSAIERYHFPSPHSVHTHSAHSGFIIDLSHTLANRFVGESHEINGSFISGWIESGTTCDAGIYRVYYAMVFNQPMDISDSSDHIIKAVSNAGTHTESQDIDIRISFSSRSVELARAPVINSAFDEVRRKTTNDWNHELSRIRVSGDPKEEKLFYSLLYRTLQSPYLISEPGEKKLYNGWSVWDNYKTQLPLLSLACPDRYKDIVTSLAGLYKSGKKNWATDHEPSNTVRTEHSIVVLLDAYRKGYLVDADFNPILDSLIRETDSLKYNHPDKALESCYDAWAMSQILQILHKDSLSAVFKQKAASWKNFWKNDFSDITKEDADDLPARGMYQGTIWQYRWFAPYDVKGLIELCGGEESYIRQLDGFFGNDLYNAANEPDIQVPYMFSGTSMPWKSQHIMHKYALDTVIQYYYNDNSRGIDPFIGRVFNNRPDAYIRTMDDDGGAMSGWYVLAAIGLSPACPGWPVWYLHVPLFRTVTFNFENGKHFTISVLNFSSQNKSSHDISSQNKSSHNKYIQSVTLNGKSLDRNWLTQTEIMQGGKLIITASDKPNKIFGITHLWISDINK